MTSNLHNCTAVIPLLDAYHDGELAVDEKVAVDDHLRGCESCSRQLAEVGKLVGALKKLPTVSLADDFADRFDALLKEPAAKTATKDNVVVFRKFGWVAAVAASFVILAGIGQLAERHNNNQIAKVPAMNSNQVSKTLQEEKLASATAPETNGDAASDSTKQAAPAQKGHLDDNAKPSESRLSPAHKKVVVARNAVAMTSRNPARQSTESEQARTTAADEKGAPEATPKHSLVAFYEPETNSIPEELGISTDEDGLYAIKM